jgi:small subunit ribosomal protein S20
LINKTRTSRVRTFIKKVELAIQSSDAPLATESFQVLQSEIQRAQSKGTMHRNTVARTLSRLSGHIKNLKETAKAA